jgi:predicted enzyme related to lactoylglutathione lyase
MTKNLFVVMNKIRLLIPLLLLSASAWAEPPPAGNIYVGAISIEPCQEAKVLADWYSLLGFETKEFKGGYYAKLDTPAGDFFFGIHRKKTDAPARSSASVSIVFHVENLAARLSSLKSKGLIPDSTESDPSEGQFAHFHDPDGNEVTLWGK